MIYFLLDDVLTLEVVLVLVFVSSSSQSFRDIGAILAELERRINR